MYCGVCMSLYYDFNHHCPGPPPQEPEPYVVVLTPEDRKFMTDCGIKVDKWEI